MNNLIKIHPSHFPAIGNIVFIIVLMFIIMVVLSLMPTSIEPQEVVEYLPLHIGLETISIVIAIMIFTQGWNSYSYKLNSNMVFLSSLFFGIAILDFSHILSYPGMPDFVTPSGANKAISFWLAARLLSSVGILIFIFLPIKKFASNKFKYISLGMILIIIVGIHYQILYTNNIPSNIFFIPNYGLSSLKLITEYIIIAISFITVVMLLLHMRKSLPYQASDLLAAICIMAMSELFFTFYSDVTDIYNIFGHIYKSIAFIFIYKAIFITTVEQPYKELEASQQQLLANEKKLNDTLKSFEHKKKELETIIQEAPNPMILHSEDGNIIRLNQAWIDYSGYSINEIPTIDAWVETMYDDIDVKASVKNHIDTLYDITSKIDEGEFTFLNKNKELITWKFSSAPLGIINGKRTIISSAMDITELKKKDDMLISQSRLAAMGEMIGMIAHQWRQPIAGIAMDANNMLLDISLEEFDINNAEEYSNSILEQTEHLSKTIDDFRNFFKPDKVLITVKLKDIIEETHSIVKESLINDSIEFRTSYESNTEVSAYPRELMQVFVNIINNAKDSLVANKIGDALIIVKVYDDDKYVHTDICDNGTGIDENVLPNIFDPYFSTKDEKTGTGLGLYMSKMIVEKHLNGKIEVSNKDRGICFKVRLPIIKSN